MNTEFELPYAGILKTETGRDYEEFGFDRAYFERLIGYMGTTLSEIDVDAFVNDHFNLLYGYLQALEHVENKKTITQETAELANMQKIVGDLSERLRKIHAFGSAGERLYDEISAFPETGPDSGEQNIRILLGDPILRPFEGILNFLDHLYIGLERAKIQKPKPHEKPMPDQGGRLFDRSHKEKILRNYAKSKTQEDSSTHYRQRAREHSFGNEYALACFTEIFKEMWLKYSDLRFTEGRYEEAARRRISRTVDAAELCLKKFGASFIRSQIETKIRRAKERAQS